MSPTKKKKLVKSGKPAKKAPPAKAKVTKPKTKAKVKIAPKSKVKVKPVKKIEHVKKHEPVKKPEPVKKVEAPKKEEPKKKIDIPFAIGEYAVYPAHGVGQIEAVESKSIMGEKMDFLVLNILDTGMNVLVPVTNIQNIGLRHVIKPAKVKEVYDILKQKKRSVVSSTWNRRYREYMEKIKSGSIFEIAEVLRDLIVLKSSKDLSFGERKMLDTAKNLLIKELALAKGISEVKIESEMQKIFSEL